jgi:hypothetical protein
MAKNASGGLNEELITELMQRDVEKPRISNKTLQLNKILDLTLKQKEHAQMRAKKLK